MLFALTTESWFVGDGKEHIFVKFQPVYWPDEAKVGVRSPGGSIYWRKNLSTMSDFTKDQSEESLETSEAGPVWNKAPFFQVKRDVGVPTIQLEQAKVDV